MIEALVEILLHVLRLAFLGLVLGVVGVFVIALLIIGYLMIANKRWD